MRIVSAAPSFVPIVDGCAPGGAAMSLDQAAGFLAVAYRRGARRLDARAVTPRRGPRLLTEEETRRLANAIAERLTEGRNDE